MSKRSLAQILLIKILIISNNFIVIAARDLPAQMVDVWYFSLAKSKYSPIDRRKLPNLIV